MEQVKSPATVINYISAIKASFMRARRPVVIFQDYAVKEALATILTTVRHIPSPTVAVPPHMLEEILITLSDPEQLTIRCFATISFTCLFRQSSIAPRTKRQFDPTRNLCRSDVTFTTQGMTLKHKWSKSEQSSLNANDEKLLPRIPGSPLCPTSAMIKMMNHRPTIKPGQPLISFRDGSPMPVTYITKVWNKTVKKLGLRHRSHTMHCLRKSGSRFLQEASGDDDMVICFGRWKSNASKKYMLDKANEQACETFTKISKSNSRKPKLRR